MSEAISIKPVSFACPKCKGPLRSVDDAFHCAGCDRKYPIASGIPDFLSPASLAPATLHIARVMDLVAPVYESRPFVWAL